MTLLSRLGGGQLSGRSAAHIFELLSRLGGGKFHLMAITAQLSLLSRLGGGRSEHEFGWILLELLSLLVAVNCLGTNAIITQSF